MEEERAVAYYEELTRKGEGAARFKQGLGFSSSASAIEAVPSRGSAIPSSSSFLSQFVRASSPGSVSKLEKDSEIRSIRDKLKKKPEDWQQPRVPDRNHRQSNDRRRSRSRERDDGHRRHRRRSRSRSRSRSKDRNDRDRRHSRRSRSRERHRDRERERDSNGDRGRRKRSRSSSPRRERRKIDDERRGEGKEERVAKVDYSQLIKGYDEMVPTFLSS